jgi:tetratricopeptide (TPR) repeat protein
VQEIGRELNVAHVLEGSVRKSGDTIRITAQLIQVEDGYHLWSENFDRKLDDVFAIQDEIAGKVAEALRIELLGELAQSSGSTDNVQAYDRYLAGRFHLRQLAGGSARKAVEEFQAALKLDPGFAQAWAGLADAYLVLEEYGGMPQEEAQSLAKEAIAKAEAIDPELPEVIVGRANDLVSKGRYVEANELFKLAINSKPNDVVLLSRAALVANVMGEHNRHDELVLKALALDPLAVEARLHVTEVDLGRGNIEAAQQRIAELEEQHPTDPVVHDYGLAVAYRAVDWAGAIRHLERAAELRPKDVFNHRTIALSWLVLGRRDLSRQWLDLAREAAPGSRYVLLGEDDQLRHDANWPERKRFWQAQLERSGFSALSGGMLASTLTRLGELDEAARLFERVLEAQGYTPGAPAHFDIDFEMRWLAWIYRQQGREDDAAVLLNALRVLYDRSQSEAVPSCLNSREFAELDELMGERESAFAHLRQAVARGCIGSTQYRDSVIWRGVQNDPAFQAILADAEAMRAEQRAIAEREGWGLPPGSRG